MIRKFTGLVLSLSPLLAIVVFALATLSIWSLTDLKRNNSLEAMLPEDDPAILFNNRMRAIFGSDEPFIIAWSAEGDGATIFENSHIRKIKRLCEKFKGLEEVEWVASLTETEAIYSEEEEVVIEPLIKAGEEDLTAEEFRQAAKRARGDPLLTGLAISKDLKTTAITLGVKHESGANDPEMRFKLSRKVKEILNEEGGEENYKLAGVSPIQEQYVEFMNSDMRLFYPLILFVLMVFMYLTFRSFMGVLLPMLIVFLTALATMGAYSFMGETLNSVTVMLPPLVMVVAISATVHYLSHSRHILPEFADRREGIKETSARVGPPIFWNSFTSSIGFGSLAVSRIVPVKKFGIYSAFGLGCGFLFTMTILPAILLRSRFAAKEAKAAGAAERPGLETKPPKAYILILEFCRYVAHKRRGTVLATAGVLAIVSGYYISQIKVETNLIDYFPEETRIRTDMSYIEERLTGILPLDVIIDTGKEGGAFDPSIIAKSEELERFLLENEKTLTVNGINSFYQKIKRLLKGEEGLPESGEEAAQYILVAEISGGKEAVSRYVDDTRRLLKISARTKYMSTAELKAFVGEVNGKIRELFGDKAMTQEYDMASAPNEVAARLTGIGVLYSNMVETLVSGQLKGFGMALFLITLVLMFVVRSVKLGLLSVVPNIIPVMLTAGAMGFLGIPLNSATAMIAGIAIGIAVDDTIHLLTFFKSFSSQGLPTEKAIDKVLDTSGIAMIATSVILFMGFVSLSVSSFAPIRDFGILCAITMFSALFGDLMVTPALLISLKGKKS